MIAITLSSFIEENQADMLAYLTDLVALCKTDLQSDPDMYAGHDCDGGSIEVRLCIDINARTDRGSWAFRTGDSSYDQAHSDYCAAGSIDLDTDAAEMLETLIDQLFD